MSSNQQPSSPPPPPPFGAPGPYPSMAYPAYYPPHPQGQPPQQPQPQPHHHHHHPHPQQHPYHHPYHPYPPQNYPQQYPPPGPGYGHGHPTYFTQPPQQPILPSDPTTASTSASSPAQAPSAMETLSPAPAPAAKSSKTGATTKTPKAKPASKATASSTSASAAAAGADMPKASSAPKTPKVFRFEGSISSESFKTSKSFDLAGVNILNRKPLDTKTALDKLQRRRETHNRVERKRRDCINQLIDDLTKLLPPKHLEETTSKCHRVNVLRGAVSHIKFLNESNEALTKSIRSIKGDEFSLDLPKEASKNGDADPGMSMDIDEEDDDDGVKGEGDSDDERTPGQLTTTMSRTGSPSSSITSTPSSPNRRMAPPPVIITDAPSPSADKIQSMKVDPFSAESRQRANSFVSSIGDMSSPRSSFSSSPVFPPSPTSPSMFGLSGQFPVGEDRVDGRTWEQQHQQQKQQQLSPYLKHSPSPSPSLPPISSLSNLHIHSPINRSADGTADAQTARDSNPNPASSFSGRSHRGPVILPPLMIPEPHHLHPSYQQSLATSSSSGARSSGTGSNRSSLTLSPNPSEQPPISPFMLSPLLPRSPSIGPTSSISPGNSPHPRWAHDGTPSPQPYPPHGSPFGQPPHSPGYGFVYPGHPDSNQAAASTEAAASAQQKTKAAHHERHKSLQPEPIFIQEEPWNTQRKRSTSSTSGKVSKSGSNKKKAAQVDEDGSSPVVYPTSPNPKKRTQITTGHETAAAGAEEASKRSKQLDNMTAPEVTVEGPPTVKVEEAVKADEEDAAQTLTSLAQISA